ncbi:MAG: hypothetical protein D4R84_14445 [Rhodocyclaceae bacterium]|nr:MAG: hypothetical protein D4R84_14445 [Rhodocyclaceae bacterium]
MLPFLKNLIGLNKFLLGKIQDERLYNEAMAFMNSNEFNHAFPLMKQSADLGNKHASVQVAMMLLKGQGAVCDWHSAGEYLQLAIAKGISNVHINLGMIYGIGGYGLKRNLEKAEFHLNKALTEDGDVDAEQMLQMLRKKQPPFGGKEHIRPKLPWK